MTRRLLTACLIAVVAGGGVSCRRVTPNIHLVVPAAFQGAILIHTKASDGVPLIPQGGTYIVTVPEDGVLRVHGDGPFYEWHTVTASFSNGDPLPYPNPDEVLDDNSVALWGGGSRTHLVYYFVGTASENRRFRAETAAADIRPGELK
jgi:hypothetical protein